MVAGLLARGRRGHPWTGWSFAAGWGSQEELIVTLVEPELVVEVGVDVARDASGRWRHPARCFLVTGAGFWWASAGDIRRVRDWRTLTGQAASVTVVGPVFLRSGLFLLVLGAAALGLYQLVDAAPYGSWLYS
ncbi:hypothetical protein GCM10010103_75780 [Streptomyces paradoxus]|uniref:Uncharacterized protein n=1 Tax=Streptomyces paradoxus TaxID=66375 RepID=A0A7W9TJ12_9ACTN|nr:DUF6336 family protein [Streptomyces paradoxus]MBB6081640.1 hypothetical protein [Streptomyces paradoxus]